MTSVVPLLNRRVVVAVDAFVEIVVWRLREPLAPSRHLFKYRLAYVVGGKCVLRFDNERGKGDHAHIGRKEKPYCFSSPSQLVADFEEAVERWNHEHGRA